MLMGLNSLVLELSGMFPSVFPFEFESMMYLSVSFIIVFFGFTGFDDHRFSAIKIENILLYRVLEHLVMIGGFLAIIFFLPFARAALTGDILLNRLELQTQEELLGGWGLLNSVMSLFANLFILAQVYSFMNLIPSHGKRK